MAAARASLITRLASNFRSIQSTNHSQIISNCTNPFPISSQFIINEFSLAFVPNCHGFSSQSSIDDIGFDPDETQNRTDETQMGFGDSVGIGDESSNFGESHVVDSWGIEESGSGSSIDGVGEISGESDGVVDGGVDAERLEAVLSLLQSSVDGSLESTLDTMGLMLSEEFVIRVIETPLVPGEHLIRFFKWASAKDGNVVTTTVLDVLVGVIGKGNSKRNAYALWDLIKEIGERKKGVLNVDVLNGLIGFLSRLGKCKAALDVFNRFEEFGCVPNDETYYLAVESLCRRSFYDWAWLVCQKMLNTGALPDSEKIGKIIVLLCKGNKPKEAYLIYLAAKENDRYPPLGVVHALIRTMSKEDETVNSALKILNDFSSEARRHASTSFRNVVSGLCRINDIDGGKSLLSKMIEGGPPPGNSVFNLIIHSLSKAGQFDEAKALLRLMESRGLKPDHYTYMVMMSGYSKLGLMDEACKIYSEAKQKHGKLSRASYHTMIRGYCRVNEYDKALKLLSEMEDDGVPPNVDEYNKLIQSLCLQALEWKTAEELLDVMKQKGLRLPSITAGLVQAVKELQLEATKSEEVSVAA